MKDTIYTIPLTDAFNAEDECPFCFIHRKLEQDTIQFTLRSSYMEEDIRALTDEAGFCPTHFKKFYDYGNRLGLALILQTHYHKVIEKLEKNLVTSSPSTPSFLQRLNKQKSLAKIQGQSPLSHMIHELQATCYVCERINENMHRYLETFFYLYHTEASFKEKFESCKGFCLDHFVALMDMSPLYLSGEELNHFLSCSQKLMIENLKRIEDDLSWFIDKYDYKNANKPWKNAQDSIPRGIQKLASIYPSDPPFEED